MNSKRDTKMALYSRVHRKQPRKSSLNCLKRKTTRKGDGGRKKKDRLKSCFIYLKTGVGTLYLLHGECFSQYLNAVFFASVKSNFHKPEILKRFEFMPNYSLSKHKISTNNFFLLTYIKTFISYVH